MSRAPHAHCDLLVIGAGAKGIAIAIKAHLLNSLGLAPLRLTVVEASRPAAAWLDGDGVTSSREVLAIPPSKDVCFPYQSSFAFGAQAGAQIDVAALAYSWQRYLVEQGRYRKWVDGGSPPVQRRVCGAYLNWVMRQASAGVELVYGEVARVSPGEGGEHWLIDVAGRHGPQRHRAGAFVLTGPGVHRTLSHDIDAAPWVLDCDSGRTEIGRAPVAQSSNIAIVGGGESALSCMEFVRSLRPDAQLTVYTPNLPMSRVESFVENRIFSNPDEIDWPSLSLQERRSFIERSDRGVFGPERLAAFSYDERCHFTAGRVQHIAARSGGGVQIEHRTRQGTARAGHDYVINCTGFDSLQQLGALLDDDAKALIERRVGRVWGAREARELPFGRHLELEGVSPRLHLPGLAALSQGPGFANLGSLGLLADRVLAPFGAAAQLSRPAMAQTGRAGSGRAASR